MSITKWFLIGLGGAVVATGAVSAQDFEKIDGALIYDYDPATKIGDDFYGTIICDFENDAPGRCSHGGPICMEYANGTIVAFHTNTSDHNLDGWSEYAVSKDRGKTWDRYNKFQYSYDVYKKNPQQSAWVEEGLVTQKGTAVCFITHRGKSMSQSGIMRSFDHGATWRDYVPIDGSFAGYPCAVAVEGGANYVLFDTSAGPHVLYVSTDDGRSWRKKSTLPLDNAKGYGALCIMKDGRLLAGAWDRNDEHHFHYCISEDKGRSWSKQKRSYVDKRVRDPEMAYLGGRYFLHGRSGGSGEGGHRFVLYQSSDGENWGSGIIISGDAQGPDGYSHNCIINQYDDDVPNELMVEYSIRYAGKDTNEYVFFIKATTK